MLYLQRKAKLQEEKEESGGGMGEKKEQKGWRTLLKALLWQTRKGLQLQVIKSGWSFKEWLKKKCMNRKKRRFVWYVLHNEQRRARFEKDNRVAAYWDKLSEKGVEAKKPEN